MIHLGDITKIHGDKVEPVDCITFGSPCQDLSIAGRRAGLAGERSGLFMEAVRIIKEMRRATHGSYPVVVIWENVPGAFSSNDGEDFRTVLEELARVEQPNAVIPGPPRGGRWSKAGAIAGNGWSLAWRQLDSQYFGVAQRRKRIALILDLGGQRAGEVLFERTSLSRHPDPCIPAWKDAAGLTANCPTGNDRVVAEGGRNTAYTLKNGHQPIVLESNQVHATVTQNGICPTLPASMGLGGGYVPMITDHPADRPVVFENHAQDARYKEVPTCSPTIVARWGTGGGNTPLVAVPGKVTSYGIGNGQAHAYASKEKSGTLDTMHDAQAAAIEYSGCLNPWDTQARRVYGEDGAFPALPSRGTAGGNQQAVLAGQRTRWIVRRLTPTECERLQGYPDGWTDIGEWVDTKGKKHKPADSPRYKALGNSIALPQWFWIAQKMKSYMGDGAKLGSLFDGIGGFPLVWETTYGTGTARWASEIEEFPIAVTKKHFPERNEHEN